MDRSPNKGLLSLQDFLFNWRILPGLMNGNLKVSTLNSPTQPGFFFFIPNVFASSVFVAALSKEQIGGDSQKKKAPVYRLLLDGGASLE